MKSILTTILAALMLLFVSFSTTGQTPKANNSKSVTASTVQVIQFHSEHRCMTCNLIEKLTRETLKKYPAIPFKLVNVDDKKNEEISEQFEATGTALFLYNTKTGVKKDLTSFAFMNAGSNENKFKAGLEKEIKNFK